MDDALIQGRSLATSKATEAAAGVKTPSNASNAVPNYNAQKDSLYQGGKGNTSAAGTQQVLDCSVATPEQLSGYAGKQCDATNFLRRNPTTRPLITVGKSDPLITSAEARAAQGRDMGLPSSMTNVVVEDPQCETKPGEATKRVEVCHEEGVLQEGQCTVGRVVEVDTNYRYQCKQSPKKIENLTCGRTLTVTCDPLVDGCDTGGIVPGSTQGDMRVWFGASGNGSYTLEFGTFADNYWSGYGAIFDRTLQFSIADKDKITKFELFNAAFDDWLLVKLNGTVVYVGPYGGDRLEVVTETSSCDEYGCQTYTKVKYAENKYGWPELDTSWNKTMAIDLRPYLNTGVNVLSMRTVVAGNGEGAIKINARMLCPQVCKDLWNDTCQALEERTR
jgi:hypothetical protein